MGVKTFIGAGPPCPRCGQESKLYRKSKNNPKSKVSAYCENAACVTKAFPPNTTKHASLRVKMGDGPPCPTCGRVTVAWKHGDQWKPKPGRYYYKFWFECLDEVCPTKQIMPPKAKVFPGKGDQPYIPIISAG